MSSPGKNNITYDELLRISKELNKNIIANKSRSKEEKIQTDNFIKQFGISRKDFTATIRKTNICFDRKAGLYEVTKDIDYKNDIKVIAIDEYKKVENIDSNYQNNDKISIDNELKKFILSLDGSVTKVAVFSTTAITKSAYGEMKKLLKNKDVFVYDNEFHCRGEFSKFHKARPNADDLKLSKQFAREIIK